MKNKLNLLLFVYFYCSWLCDFAFTEIGVELSNELNYRQKFEDGKAAYFGDRWQDCVRDLEASLIDYEKESDLVIECQRSCQNVDLPRGQNVFTGSIDSLRLSAKLTRMMACSKDCENVFEDHFDKLKVYSYLQHCYFQNKMPQKAASAVYTILQETPGDKTMLSYLLFYAGLPEVDQDKIVKLQILRSGDLYERASLALAKQNYTEVIELAERSLKVYLNTEMQCRASCDHKKNLDQHTALINVVNRLACRQRCSEELDAANEDIHNKVLIDHYRFLHTAYYNLGQVLEAIEAAASILLLVPQDGSTLTTTEHYKNLLYSHGMAFKARKEVIEYVHRRQQETKLLQLINRYISRSHLDEEDLNDYPNEILKKEGPLHDVDRVVHANHACAQVIKNLGSSSTEERDNIVHNQMEEIFCEHTKEELLHSMKLLNSDIEKLMKRFNIQKSAVSKGIADMAAYREVWLKDTKLVKSDEELFGKNRFVAEGLANEEECKAMVDLAQVAIVPGSGYNGVVSPYSKQETHAGMWMSRAAKLTNSGIIKPHILDLFFDIGDRSKLFLERHFKKKLYFQFSELVCRTSKQKTPSGSQVNMSHPIHADNCRAYPDGRCTNKLNLKSNAWRDYSTLVYMNEDFEGGEFVFAGNLSTSSIKAEVTPKCGRMAGFSSGGENLHGVRGVRNGQRCAVATWFTATPAQLERTRVAAQMMRDRLRLSGDTFERVIAS